VTREQAKHILLLYRPGTADWQDPDVAAAIDLARRDLDLAAWFSSIRLSRRRCAPGSAKSKCLNI
jgi:hypothetical protein